VGFAMAHYDPQYQMGSNVSKMYVLCNNFFNPIADIVAVSCQQPNNSVNLSLKGV
jgi:hypothetical protein